MKEYKDEDGTIYEYKTNYSTIIEKVKDTDDSVSAKDVWEFLLNIFEHPDSNERKWWMENIFPNKFSLENTAYSNTIKKYREWEKNNVEK